MAEPFTNSAHGYSQVVTADEMASGTLAIHLGFKDGFLQHRQDDGRCCFRTADGATFLAPVRTAFPPAIGPSAELRQFLARNGIGAGAEVALAFDDPAGISITLGGTPAPVRAPGAMQPQPDPVMTQTSALNSILYGPPGTGKTFRTAELAVRICDGHAGTARREVMSRYEALRQAGRIQFVTFHQSYGYEDFVEGIRPESIDGQISYPVRPGIFRRICDAARRSAMARPGLSGKPLKDRAIYKMSLGRSGTAEGNRVFQHCVENGAVLLGGGEDDAEKRSVEVFRSDMQIGDIVVVSQGNHAYCAIGEVTGEYAQCEEPAAGRYRRMRQVRWLVVFDTNRDVSEILDRNFTQASLYRLDHNGLRLDVLQRLIEQGTAAGPQNFVLIIDEINRANISKVFGELITLIEPDKREGEENALTVKLPYSGDDFAVPPNLYIVGTMNTADRSIALLDTALRRRFEFEELQPDYAVLPPVPGVDLAALLAALNERVEYLYDRDHTIGHAYFMQVRTPGDLDAVFRRKVIPLLQEYFHEDWSKLRLVLNDRDGHFIRASAALPKGLELAADVYEPRPRYRIRSEPFAMEAYLNIYR